MKPTTIKFKLLKYFLKKFTRLYEDYIPVKRIFTEPVLYCKVGRWRKDICLPVWRRGNTIQFGKYNERNDTYNYAKLVKSEWTETGKKNHPILSKIFKPTYVLPMWLSFYKFNHGMMWKTKWGEYRYEFPPQFTLVFFGLSISFWLKSPKEAICDEYYWEPILIYNNEIITNPKEKPIIKLGKEVGVIGVIKPGDDKWTYEYGLSPAVLKEPHRSIWVEYIKQNPVKQS